MNKELVYIKDNIENTHCIYTNEVDLEYDFSKCYDWICKQFKIRYPESVTDLRYTITDNTCIIYCEEENVKKGWIWNSVDTKKKVLYELSKIPVAVVIESTVETVCAETMTDECCVETITEKCFSIGTSMSELVPVKKTISMQTDNFTVQKSYLDQVYNNPDNIFTYFDTNPTTEFVNEFSHWCSTELEPVISNISKLSLGNEGYAPNPFTPINTRNPFLEVIDEKEALRIELKKKLAQPNYGLRSVNF